MVCDFMVFSGRMRMIYSEMWFIFCCSLFKTDETPSKPVDDDKYVARRICNGIIYYSTPITPAGSHDPCSAKDSQPLPPSDDSSSLLSETQTDTTISTLNQSRSRPLLVFFSWLGAQPVAVAKYRNLYLERGMDVLLVQSSVMHFLWPRWGLDYGLEVLHILEEPPFSGRDVLVHASSIGGYTFTQVLTHIAQEPKRHGVLAQRVIGHIYDSLVVGSLEHMATGEWKWPITQPHLQLGYSSDGFLSFNNAYWPTSLVCQAYRISLTHLFVTYIEI